MTNTYTGPERRRFKRVKVKLTVIFRMNAPMEARLRTEDKEAEATMIDLCEGGLSILTDIDVPVTTLLRVKFTLTRVENECVNFYGSIELNGEVRYRIQAGKGYRLGISFQNIDEKSRKHIKDFINMVEMFITPQRLEK